METGTALAMMRGRQPCTLYFTRHATPVHTKDPPIATQIHYCMGPHRTRHAIHTALLLTIPGSLSEPSAPCAQ